MKKVRLALRLCVMVGLILSMGVGAAWAARIAVKSDIANMRFGPGTDHEVLWQVEKYHPFIVMDRKGKWIKVKDYEGDQAWVHESIVSAKVRGVVTVKSKCNVRNKPSTKGDVKFTVEKGVPFKVLKTQGNWLKIQHADGESGWIYKTLVW